MGEHLSLHHSPCGVGRQTLKDPNCTRPFLDSCLSLSSPRKFSLELRSMCFYFLMKSNRCSRSQRGEEWVKEGGELLVWECIVEQRKYTHSISQDMSPRDHINACVRKKRELIFWLPSCKASLTKLCPKKKDVPSTHLWNPSASFTDPHAFVVKESPGQEVRCPCGHLRKVPSVLGWRPHRPITDEPKISKMEWNVSDTVQTLNFQVRVVHWVNLD